MLPASDRHFAHSFGNQHRVLAFGGKLLPHDGQLEIAGFVLSCSGRLATAQTAKFHAELNLRLTSGGWRSAGNSWKQDRAVLALASGEATASSQILHIVLTIDDPDETTYRRVFGHVSKQTAALSRNLDQQSSGLESTPAQGVAARLLSVTSLAREMNSHRVMVYTGAGVSLASGIATFDGDGSLTKVFPLMDSFPGIVLDWMIDRPQELMSVLGHFQTALLSSKPNAAHHAIAQLERLGPVVTVVTNNFDHLHEAAGSRQVFRTHEGGASKESEKIDLLVVTGVSTDEYGLVDRLRTAGVNVVAIGPRPPGYLTPGDGFVEGIAEEVFPSVVRHISNVRRREARSLPPPCTSGEFSRLARAVSSKAPHPNSKVHGDSHWRRVAFIAAHLASRVPGGDPWLALLFALFHDSQRHTDGEDPEHGARAADLVRQLEGTLFELSAPRRSLLERACVAHALGEISCDPTVGLCWDSDRLDLWRCGIAPDPEYLSTAAALEPTTREWASQNHGASVSWSALYDLYSNLEILNGRPPKERQVCSARR